MTLFEPALNTDVRQYVKDNKLLFAVLVDTNGNDHTTIDVAADSRATWTSDATNNPATLEIQVSGGDSDINPPVTIDQVDFYETSNKTTRLVYDVFGDATIDQSGDTLTLTTDLEVPNL